MSAILIAAVLTVGVRAQEPTSKPLFGFGSISGLSFRRANPTPLSHFAQGAPMAAQTFQSTDGSNRSLRLTFEYKGADVRLISQQSVEMMVPPSDRTDEYTNHAGFWIELRDREDRVVYRRIMHSPIQLDREAPSGDPQRTFTRVPADSAQGVFTVLVPDVAYARDVRLVGSPPSEPARAAKEILRVDLAEGPRPKQEAR
jgi:hypothetical protein